MARVILSILLTSCVGDPNKPSEGAVRTAYQLATQRQLTIEEFNREYTIEYIGKGQTVVNSPTLKECFPEQLKTATPPIVGDDFRVVVVSRTNIEDTTHFSFEIWPNDNRWWVTQAVEGKNRCYPINK